MKKCSPIVVYSYTTNGFIVKNCTLLTRNGFLIDCSNLFQLHYATMTELIDAVLYVAGESGYMVNQFVTANSNVMLYDIVFINTLDNKPVRFNYTL